MSTSLFTTLKVIERPQHPEAQSKPFPVQCLPPIFQAMARAIAETERTPLSLSGCCVLGILSGSIGKGLQIQSAPNRFTRGNLFILASAESGSGKSETHRHAARPFIEFEKEGLQRWKASTLPGLSAEKDMLEVEIKKLRGMAGRSKGPDEREETKAQLEAKNSELAKVESLMSAPVLSVEDVTTERLAALLSKNGETLMSMSPDAGAIVNNVLGRYNKTDRTDEGIYLKAFSGDYCRVDRQSREPVLLESPCLAALWLTQPDKIETLLGEQSLIDGGLMPRFLTCHTNAQALPIGEDPAGIHPDTSFEYQKAVSALLRTYRPSTEAKTFAPNPDAKAALTAHFNGSVKRRQSDLQDVQTFVARWGEQAWRLAVCLHAGLHGARAHEHSLEFETAQDAIELAEWFAGQQLEILSGGRDKMRRKIRDDVFALLMDSPNGITVREVQRARIKPNAEEARRLLEAMASEFLLSMREEKPKGGGHVTQIFTKAR